MAACPAQCKAAKESEGLHDDTSTDSHMHTNCYGNDGATLRLWLGD
jgi:hypothetical protein